MTGRKNGGNGRNAERRGGVDRRITHDMRYRGPERRLGPRRRNDRSPDKPVKR